MMIEPFFRFEDSTHFIENSKFAIDYVLIMVQDWV